MAEEQEMDINDNAVALDDTDTPENFQVKSVVDYIMERYKKSDDYRQQDEDRWLRAYRNYQHMDK
jgi:hypothetical protein